jgi:flagellar biosynthetic protein FliO
LNFLIEGVIRVREFLLMISDSSAIPVYTNPIGTHTSSIFIQALRTLGALAVVLCIMGAVVWALKRFKISAIPGVKEGLVKILGKVSLSQKQGIYVVEVPGHILVLGVSGENITYLTEIEPGKDGAYSGEKGNDTKKLKNVSISQYLQNFIEKFKSEKKSPDRNRDSEVKVQQVPDEPVNFENILSSVQEENKNNV